MLIHCSEGRSPAAAVVMAYLMWKEDISWLQAFDTVNNVSILYFTPSILVAMSGPVPSSRHASRDMWGRVACGLADGSRQVRCACAFLQLTLAAQPVASTSDTDDRPAFASA